MDGACYDKAPITTLYFTMINKEYLNSIYIQKLFNINTLYKSFKKCRKGVDWKYSVQKFEVNLLVNLYNIKKELQFRTYKQRPFFEFDIFERGKLRHITALNIRDRIVQRALCDDILMPKLTPYLIYDNGASVKDKGIDFARDRLKHHLRQYYINEHTNDGYILKIDFRHYFESIDHDIAINMLSTKIDDPYIINLVKDMINAYPKGIGLGSQVSQVIGLYYASPIDMYCKVVKSCKYYGRYMDDIYVIHKSKIFLKSLLIEICNIANSIKLTINEKKTQILKLSKRFVFLKIRYFLTNTGKVIIIPDKSIIIREKRKLKKFKMDNKSIELVSSQYQSVRGMLKKYNSFNMLNRLDNYYVSLFGKEYATWMKKNDLEMT